MIRPASSVFKSPDFTPAELERIFTAAAGGTYSFRSVSVPVRPCSSLTPSLVAFARGEDWRTGLPVSPRRLYQVLADYRSHPTSEHVIELHRAGLSLRQLSRLFKISVPTVQRHLSACGSSVLIPQSSVLSDSSVLNPQSSVLSPKEA